MTNEHLTILIDDEPSTLSFMKVAFDIMGTPVLTFSDGAAGLKALESNDVALIITDYTMPSLSGLEVLKKAQEISPDTIRVLMTGDLDLELAVKAVSHGEVYRILRKPWDDIQLKSTVYQCLEKYDSIRNHYIIQEELLEQAKAETTRAAAVTLNHEINNILLCLSSDISTLGHAYREKRIRDDHPEMLERMQLCCDKIRDIVVELATIERIAVSEYCNGTMMIDTKKSE